MKLARSTPALALLACLATPSAAQHVLVVDVNGGGDFTTVVAAVDAAASGDTILIEDGYYSSFGEGGPIVVAGKSLALVGDGPMRPRIPGGIVVRDLPADGFLQLRGLELGEASGQVDAAVACHADAGTVWIEDCVLVGGPGSSAFVCEVGDPALEVIDCAGVFVVRCVLSGGPGANDLPAVFACHDSLPGGPGLFVENGSVTVHDSLVSGGTGGLGFHDEGAPGGPGVRAIASQLVLSGVDVVGGQGGQLCSDAALLECQGGPGLQLDGDTSLALLDTTWLGGPGGLLDSGLVAPDGPELVATPRDELLAFAGLARSLAVGSPVRESQAALLRYEGERGDTFGVFFAALPAYLPLSGQAAVFALGAPLFGPSLVVTVTAPDGVFEIPFRAADVTSLGLEGASVYGQCLLVTKDGATLLSSPTSLTVIAAGF